MNPQASPSAGVPAQPAPAPQARTAHQAAKKISKNDILGALKYLGQSIIKPFQTFKSNSNIDSPKFAFTIVGITAVAMTILGVIARIVGAIVTKEYSGKHEETVISTLGLKRADFLGVTFKYLLLYIGLLLVVAGVFYLANLVAKRQVTFGRFLTVATTASLPWLIGTFLKSIFTTITYATTDYSELAGKTPFGTYVATSLGVIGLVYSIVIAVSLINNEMSFDDKSHALYFASIALAIVLVAANIVIPKVEDSVYKSMTKNHITVRVDNKKYDCDDQDFTYSDDNYEDIVKKCQKALGKDENKKDKD